MEVRVSKNFVLAELTRELYHNPAILDICDGDNMVVDDENYAALMHDLCLVYVRVLTAASTFSDAQK